MDQSCTIHLRPLRADGEAGRPAHPGAAARRARGWTLLACAAILICRRPELVQSPQLWAEDGPVFFLQSRTLGAAALFEPSAGYLHTALRLIAALAAWFDPLLTPAIYVGAAALLTLYVAARTQSPRFPLPPSCAYAFAVVLVPDAGEVLLNLTNLQWVLGGGLLLLLISADAGTRAQRIHDFVTLVVLGLTGPFILVLAPLFVWRAGRRRTRLSTAIAAVALACALTQALTIGLNPHEMTQARVALEFLAGIPGRRVAGSLLGGGHLGATNALFVCSLLGITALAGVAWLARRGGPARSERVWLGLAWTGMLAAALYRCRFVLPDVFYGAGPRYFFLLQLITLWLLISVAADRPNRWSRVARGVLAWIAIVNGPRLREPALADLNWAGYAARIHNGEQVTVRINPDNWEFTMPGTGDGDGFQAGLVNVSMRCRMVAGQPAHAGFTVQAGRPRKFLIRAIGPSLAQFGIEQPLLRPSIVLMCGATEWPKFTPRRNGPEAPEIQQATQRCRAFPLEPNTADLAAIVELPPGVYSLLISGEAGANDTAGEVLVEVFEIPAAL